jgi:CRP/FNR family cyclic AMP-dependent transcriptional regulator
MGGQDGWVGRTAFLLGLDEADSAVLRQAGHEKRHAAGEHLCLEGDPPNQIWFLLEGHVKLSKVATNGREIVLEIRGPGDVIGEMGLVDGQPRSATATTLDDALVLVLTGDRFRTILRERANVATRLFEELVRRLRQASDRQLELGTVSVVGRLCGRLVELARSHGINDESGILISAGISQQELAEWCGSSRDSVVRALTGLREAGLLESRRGEVIVLDLAAIEALASH